jgi:hypothetical protein
MRQGYRFLLHAAAVCLLLAIFMLYTRAEFMVEIANQVWACF